MSSEQRVYLADSRIHGEGVFAAVDIAEGEWIFEIDESTVVPPYADIAAIERLHKNHCDYLAGGKVVIIPPPMGCVNHCCDPNSYKKTIDGVKYRIARRDIAAGEEITGDYCINSRGDTGWECNCGSERCRRMIHSDFFRLPLALQVEYLPLLDDWFVDENRERVDALRSRSPSLFTQP